MARRKLFFDLETTGLPERCYAPWPSSEGGQTVKSSGYFPPKEYSHYNGCRIVSIAWLIYEGNTLLKEVYRVIYPDGFTSSSKSIEIHKITDDYARMHGVPINTVFRELDESLTECGECLSYNLDFDFNVLLAEAWRYNNTGIITKMDSLVKTCIMKESRTILGPICGVIKKYYKLEETYRHLFGDKTFKTAHNALDDIRRAGEIYYRLHSIDEVML